MRKTLFKRGVAIALTMLMILSCVPRSAFAETKDMPGTDVETIVETQEETNAVADEQESESTQEDIVSIEPEETIPAETEETLPLMTEETAPVTTEETIPAVTDETVSATTEETIPPTSEETSPAKTEEIISPASEEASPAAMDETTSSTTEVQETEAVQEEAVQETEEAPGAAIKAAPALKATRGAGDAPATVRYTGKTTVGDNGTYKYGYSGFAESGAKSVPVKLKADNGETFIGICARPDKDGYPKNSGGVDKKSYYLSVTQEVTKITDPLIRKILFYGFISSAAHDAKKELYGSDYRCAVYTLVSSYYSTYKWTRSYAITHHALAKRYHAITSGDDSIWDYQLLSDTKAKVQEYIDTVSALPDPPDEYEVYRVENPANKPVSEGGKGWNDQVYFFERVMEKESVYIRVKKRSASGTYAPSVEGIRYAIYATREKAEAGGYSNVIKAEDEDGNEKAAILTVGTDGWSTNAFALEEGTYYMKEYSTNENYTLSTQIKSFKINGENSTNFTPGEGEDDYDFAYVTFDDEPILGKGAVVKTSSNPSVTDGNNNYSMAGIKYQIKKGSTVAVTVTLKADGTHTPVELDPGTYTVVESSVPAASGYLKSGEEKSMKVVKGETTTVQFKNDPVMAPVNVLLAKIDAENKAAVPQGDLSLAGAIYELSYYNNHTASGTAKNTWQFQTDENGMLIYDDEYKVSGPALLKDPAGVYALPLGSFTIREVEAPYGYKVSDTDFKFDIKLDSKGVIDVYWLEAPPAITLANGDTFGPKAGEKAGFVIDGQTVLAVDADEPSVKISTTAKDGQTDDQSGTVGKTETLIDTVSYQGLTIGEAYTITGTLHFKEGFTDSNGTAHAAGDAVVDQEGNEITSSVTFVAEAGDGTIDLTYTLDSELLRGTSIIVFEDIKTGDITLYSHADLEDDTQRVDYPDVRTQAKEGRTEDHVGSTGKISIIDSVELTNLTISKIYTVSGTLMDKETGKAIIDKEGKEVTATYGPFEADAADMVIEMAFEANVESLAGKTTVVFEDLLHNDVVVSYHRDIEDEEQSIHFPEIGTTATADDTKDHVTKAREEVTITDVVRYENLLADGHEYTMKGYLVNKATGEALLVNGEKIQAETTFVPVTASGEVELTFTLNASALEGTTLVVFETLYYKDVEVAIHADVEEGEQTVYIPEIKTKACDEKTLIDHTLAEREVTVKDTVFYTNLLPGKTYTLKGYLADKKTGEPIIIDGERVEAEKIFTAESTAGEEIMEFTFDATSIIGAPLVVFEQLYYNDVEIAAHADIEDEEQTDYIPEIGTTATAQDTEDHVTYATKEVTIIDVVTYTGLKPETEYEVQGILMDKETGEPILLNGEEVTSDVNFMTGAAEDGEVSVNGTVELAFAFDASALAGTTTVVFERLYQQGKEVAVHADINDEAQTVYIPEIRTTASDTATGDHDGHLDTEITIVDEVIYTDLLPGKTYTVTGKLMDKSTGKELKIDGKTVSMTRTFTPETPDGSVTLEFVINSSALSGTTIVVFEEVRYNDRTVAIHADIDDEDQSVHFPEIGTKASKKETNGNMVTIVDMVSYKGLTPGKTYIVKGVLMDKGTKQSTGNTSQTRFTAQSERGAVEVVFKVRAADIDGKTLVVFEKLCDLKDNLIARHEDIDDQDQTIAPNPKMGDESNTPIWGGITLAAFLGIAGCTFMIIRRRKKEDKT